jgi:hypothetical protein
MIQTQLSVKIAALNTIGVHMQIKRYGLLLATAILTVSSAASTLYPAATTSYAAQSRAAAATDSRPSIERIRRHVEYLASEKLQGRRTGTDGIKEAAAYIFAEFKRYGLRQGGNAGYYQPFNFITGVKLGDKNSFELKTQGSARSLKAGEDFMPLAFSSNEQAAGPLVFVGYGISAPDLQYDNYAGVDVKGRVVMILRGGPDGDNPHGKFAEYTAVGREIQTKVLKAREKGASGVIFISEEKSFSNDRLFRLRHDLNFLDSGIPTVLVSRDVAQRIIGSALATPAIDNVDVIEQAKKSLAPGPDSPRALSIDKAAASFKTDVVKINGLAENVVGILDGSDPQLKSEYVVIGAHYDHLGLGGPESLASRPEGQIHYGADDNASGTSALIELARVLSAERSRIKRSVVFIAFSGEEMGLLGSAAYTRNPSVPLASTVAMFNMDMVGRLRTDGLFIGGVGTSPVWKPLIDKLNAVEPPAGAVGNGSGSRFKLTFGQDGFGPSDHQSFYVRDIPVLFFFTGTHADYHKPSDTAEKINLEGIGEIAGLVRDMVIEVANEPTRIAFTKVKAESRPTGRGFRVYLGTVPNYSDQSDGMKLDGVRAGSPAERAGLRAGDIVVRMGKFPIKNVYDYTYALGEMAPGVEIEVAILRDGKPMNLKLTPDKRQ